MTVDFVTQAVHQPEPRSPIKSGWRGHLNGCVEGCDGAQIKTSEITLRLDHATAWALCNLLADSSIQRSGSLESAQGRAMSNLGAALGRLIDHGSANNGGRTVVKT